MVPVEVLTIKVISLARFSENAWYFSSITEIIFMSCQRHGNTL